MKEDDGVLGLSHWKERPSRPETVIGLRGDIARAREWSPHGEEGRAGSLHKRRGGVFDRGMFSWERESEPIEAMNRPVRH